MKTQISTYLSATDSFWPIDTLFRTISWEPKSSSIAIKKRAIRKRNTKGQKSERDTTIISRASWFTSIDGAKSMLPMRFTMFTI